MLFSKKTIVYPFSGFEGQILFQGKPASHATVKRNYNWDGTDHEMIIKADSQGRFSFGPVAIESKISLQQFVSHQSISVTFMGKNFDIWIATKLAPEEFSEFGSRIKNLTCELTEKRRAIQQVSGFVGTSCHWELF